MSINGQSWEPTTTRGICCSACRSAEFEIGSRNKLEAVVGISNSTIRTPSCRELFSRAASPSSDRLLETFLPEIPDLSLPFEPAIDQFALTYDKPNDYLMVSMHFTMPDWEFTFPFTRKALFSLDSVGFAISRQNGQNTGNITAHTTLLPTSRAPIGVEVGAFYEGDSNWRFIARTTTEIDIDVLIKEYLGDDWISNSFRFPSLKDVGVTLVWGKNGSPTAKAKSFEFTAKTAKPWQPIPVLGDNLSATFDLTLGYTSGNTQEPKLTSSAAMAEQQAGTALVLAGAKAEKEGPYGKLSAEVTLWNIHLNVNYDFDPEVQKVCVTWTDVGISACVEKSNDADTIATFVLDGESVGSIVEKFVLRGQPGQRFGLVAATWDILDDIQLSKLKITYNFTKKKVDFTIPIGPIDLGLFKLTGITLDYNPDGNPTTNNERSKNKVQITVNGSFAWQTGDAISWEPDDPSTTPAPPGGGSKYFCPADGLG